MEGRALLAAAAPSSKESAHLTSLSTGERDGQTAATIASCGHPHSTDLCWGCLPRVASGRAGRGDRGGTQGGGDDPRPPWAVSGRDGQTATP